MNQKIGKAEIGMDQPEARGRLAKGSKAGANQLSAAFQQGVIPAIETMINTSTISKLIVENRLEKLHVAIETGTEDGMQNFNQSLFQLVKDDIITKEEALEKATNAQALEMNFKGIFLSEGSRILN